MTVVQRQQQLVLRGDDTIFQDYSSISDPSLHSGFLLFALTYLGRVTSNFISFPVPKCFDHLSHRARLCFGVQTDTLRACYVMRATLVLLYVTGQSR